MKDARKLPDYSLDYDSYFDNGKGRTMYSIHFVKDGIWKFLHRNLTNYEARKLCEMPLDYQEQYVKTTIREQRVAIVAMIVVVVFGILLLITRSV